MTGGPRKRRNALVVFALGLLVSVSSTPAAATFPGANGRIAFVWAPDENADVYSIDEHGCGLTRLTTDPGRDLYPSWSPDGSRIVWQNESPGPVQSTLNNWVMSSDGSGAFEIGDDSSNDAQAIWSPAGSKLAFRRELEPGRRPTFVSWEIFTVDADGGNEARLTDDEEPDDEPSWSPDGSRLAFTHRTIAEDPFNPAPSEIYVMDADDGGNRTQLTSNAVPDLTPQWSPAGDVIMFLSQRNGVWDIYTIRSDGMGETQVTNDAIEERHPRWSPDGSKIVFWAGGSNDIFTVNADGSGLTMIGDDVGKYPKFSPDGQNIVFSGADETTLRTMRSDGTGNKALIGDRDEPAAGPFADWQPATTGGAEPDQVAPEITAVSDYPDPFTPNGDGNFDLTYVRYTLSEDATTTVTIVKKGRVIARLRNSYQCAGPREVAWRGRSKSGRKVPAGRYGYRIKAVDPSGNVGTARGSVAVK